SGPAAPGVQRAGLAGVLEDGGRGPAGRRRRGGAGHERRRRPRRQVPGAAAAAGGAGGDAGVKGDQRGARAAGGGAGRSRSPLVAPEIGGPAWTSAPGCSSASSSPTP